MTKVLLTVPEICEATGLGRTKVYQLLQSGELRAVHVGKSVRILPAELERFVGQLQAEQGIDA